MIKGVCPSSIFMPVWDKFSMKITLTVLTFLPIPAVLSAYSQKKQYVVRVEHKFMIIDLCKTPPIICLS